MKKKLMAKFLPVQFRQEAFIEYHNFKQSGGMLVEEFTSEFDRLRLRCDVVGEEEETIAHNGHVFDEYEDDKYKQHSDQAEITYVDCGEALVVRRSLSMVTEDNESWLRHNIFHTTCTSLGKVCNVIIDGGSCENVISSIMVDKLFLEYEEHSKPYKLSWFKKGNEVKVLEDSPEVEHNTCHVSSTQQQCVHYDELSSDYDESLDNREID
ncbi:hypothetical protein Tco_0298458, partial [Tanacetum coccineum]